MLKKSTLKSKPALKTKSAASKAKPHGKSAPMASWTINQVGDLLDAVNKVTLKRMEDQNKTTYDLLKAVNEQTLKRIEEAIAGAWQDVVNVKQSAHDINERLIAMDEKVQAIKDKVHA